jgi:cytochrome c oxidase cbb3-type subunit 3
MPRWADTLEPRVGRPIWASHWSDQVGSPEFVSERLGKLREGWRAFGVGVDGQVDPIIRRMRRMSGVLATLGLLGFLFALTPLGLTAQSSRSLGTAGSTDIAAGKRIFDAQCAWCHGTNGTGGTGPSLQRATLRHAANDSALVGIVRKGIPGTEMPNFEFSLTDRTAWQTAAYVRTLGRITAQRVPGDVKRGGALYVSAGCGTCHVIDGGGHALGPELTAIGALRGASHLRESIVNPAAAHQSGYLVVRAVTDAGREIRGIRLTEDVFWILIRDATGSAHVLQKSELSRLDRELEATLMPSYATRFSDADLDDVVAYLSNLRGPS